MKKVLELPAFRRLLVAYTLNELAASIGAVALALLVYRRTGSALGAAGFFLCAEFGPALVSPLFVARLDQQAAARVLGLLYALQAVLFLALAWLVGRFELISVLALSLINGVFAVTARVLARAAWTSFSRSAGLLREANAIINGSFSICFLIGPAIGGGIVALDGTVAALLANVGAYALISLIVATARDLPEAVPDRASALKRVRSALEVARRDPVIRRLLGLQGVGMLFFTISIPVEVVFAQHTLHAGAGGYGVLLSAWGGGAILGSALYARWRALASRMVISLGSLLLGAGFLIMAVAPSLAVAIAGAAVAGIGNGIVFVAMRTALQEATPERWLALILSLNESILLAVPGIGILTGGAIAAIAGPRAAFAAGAGGSLAIAALMWLKLGGADRQEPVRTGVPDEPAVPEHPLTAVTRRP
jgi:Na+/melibiose symporter-like transporter